MPPSLEQQTLDQRAPEFKAPAIASIAGFSLGKHERFDSGNVSLSLYRLPGADPDKPVLLMLHGVRDVAPSLLPVAEYLRASYQVVLADLRGHGYSSQPGAYAMENFLHDLHQLCDYLSPIEPLVLFGHSLGGQIVSRFGGIWPDRVHAALIVEGIGPPAHPAWSNPSDGDQVERYGEQLLNTFALTQQQRVLPSLDFAAERLCKNNPRLSPDWAQQLVKLATKLDAQGNLVWAFDPRVQTVFSNLSEAQGELYWRRVTCPTLVVGGALAHEYWSGGINHKIPWDGKFAPGEYEARAANFNDHQFILLPNAGHMVHYDEPDLLGQLTFDYLEQHR